MTQNERLNKVATYQGSGPRGRLEDVHFNLSPPVGLGHNSSPQISVMAELVAASMVVLRSEPTGRLTPAQEEQVAANAAELGVELALYCVSVAAGWREAHPGDKLPAGAAAGPWAVKQVEAHRAIAADQYGYFDERAVAAITKQAEPACLINSELFACRQTVVGRLNGSNTSLTHMYENRELALDPVWLATEPSYWRWLANAGGDEAPSPELRKHRRRAHLCTKYAAALAVARGHFCRQAMVDALAARRVDHTKLSWPTEVRQAAVFWMTAADAAKPTLA